MQPTIEIEDNEEMLEDLPTFQQEEMEKELEELRKYEPLVKLMADACGTDDHPKPRDVHNWKKKYGKIYVSAVADETDIYVWRPIYRQEWKNLQESQAVADKSEKLVEMCLLFPRMQTVLYEKPAGTIPALETKIMFQSGFVGDQYLLSSIKEIL